jgi:N-acetylglucosamine-6-phosphate deacetylase
VRLEGVHYRTNGPVAITIAGGVIRAIDAFDGARSDLPIVAPGLVDLQVNGFAGHDVNATPLAPETVGAMIRALWKEGTTSCFPTVITNSDESIGQSMRSIARACEEDPAVGRGVAGVHLEGPFISTEDGARGAHAKQFVRPPDWDTFRRWQDAAGGRIRIVTLSPEWPETGGFIGRAVAAGVTGSIGHTAATPAQIGDAVRAGARMITHFGNAAHLMLPRHPNYLWELLAQDDLWACLIADGFHLPDQVIKVAMRVKGERAMIVSDAVSLAGMPPGEYGTPVGGRVVLTPAGRLHLAENDRLLAGSAQALPWGVNHLVKSGLATLADAWDMASTRPAGFMGLNGALGLAVGGAADVVLLRPIDNSLKIERTYKAGSLA